MSDLRTTDADYGMGEKWHILGTCPHCRLPVYAHDGRDLVRLPPGSPPEMYHAGCAYRAQVRFWQDEANHAVQNLRTLRCYVKFEITVPVS